MTMDIRNGMPATDLGAEGWVKPWSGSNGGDCLEARKLPGGQVAMRQSTDPHGPALILQPNEIRAFVTGAKAWMADALLARRITHWRRNEPVSAADIPVY